MFQGAVLLGQAEIWLPPKRPRAWRLSSCWPSSGSCCSCCWPVRLLDCLLSLGRHTRQAGSALRGIFQGVKLVASILVGILMIALLLGKSPLFLFSSLGAMTAVLMLVFKDPIPGLVAGIQLSANRMLSVGDWLQMDKVRGGRRGDRHRPHHGQGVELGQDHHHHPHLCPHLRLLQELAGMIAESSGRPSSAASTST